jgi:hypothetical protein
MAGDAPDANERARRALPDTCPSCGATVRADVSWCTQCYAPLTGPTVRPDGPAAEPALEPEADQPAGQVPLRATDPEKVARLADQMLAQLAAERDELPGLASRLPATPAARAVLVTVLVVVGAALVLLLMFVAGSLF